MLSQESRGDRLTQSVSCSVYPAREGHTPDTPSVRSKELRLLSGEVSRQERGLEVGEVSAEHVGGATGPHRNPASYQDAVVTYLSTYVYDRHVGDGAIAPDVMTHWRGLVAPGEEGQADAEIVELGYTENSRFEEPFARHDDDHTGTLSSDSSVNPTDAESSRRDHAKL